MSKVMLVEDDANLLEIYQARLAAEGFQIVTAKDGEEALAIAVKERPDLIIADIMMPKVSGFDMLDILRSTPETKNVKIIMMTALSQLEDKQRAEKLGADRYLVKSQVTLEDVVRVVNEVLSGEKTSNIGNIPVEQPEPQAQPTAAVSTSLTEGVPSTAMTEPVATAPVESTPMPAPSAAPSTGTSAPATLPVDTAAPNQTPTQEAPAQQIPVISEKREHKVIEPTPGFTTDKPNIDSLLAQESAQSGPAPAPQLNSVIQPAGASTASAPAPAIPPAGTTMEPVLNTPAPKAQPATQPTPPQNNQLIQ